MKRMKYKIPTPDEWLQEFLDKIDFKELALKIMQAELYRAAHPDWERPVVMYGVRKLNKYFKKPEIAVVIDKSPWCDRAKMAETHWYKIIYKRPATDLEWQEVSGETYTRRYVTWRYFINKDWHIDKIVSHIVQDDSEEYDVDTKHVIAAFERYYNRKIRIYRRPKAIQLSLF